RGTGGKRAPGRAGLNRQWEGAPGGVGAPSGPAVTLADHASRVETRRDRPRRRKERVPDRIEGVAGERPPQGVPGQRRGEDGGGEAGQAGGPIPEGTAPGEVEEDDDHDDGETVGR